MGILDLTLISSFDCQGGWENDETVEQAACREALEEAGVRGILGVCSTSWLSTSTKTISLTHRHGSYTHTHPLAWICSYHSDRLLMQQLFLDHLFNPHPMLYHDSCDPL